MTSREIRQKFLSFFENKKHKVVPSAPMVIKDDPTLLFTNAGMNQFKDYFLGNKQASFGRAVDTQKCLRVSGKHNDLEEVGHDTYHHTMFEMLGNWSFGDYFKKEAIEWAWQLLTEEYKLPKERLYATVFEGDKNDNIHFDQDAYDIWTQYLPKERILNGDKSDNFWEMGDTGPCGPASEIHIDLRDEKEIEKVGGRELVNKDHPLVVEIWNLVFMQYNRLADSSLVALPEKHVDTGMGFERLCMAIQNKKSNYDTDVFTPLLDKVAEISKTKYGQNEENDIAYRVIVDHIRAIALSIADGQLPSNNKAGYVIRRILRRATRYGYTFLHLKEPFLYQLISTLAKQFEDVFPELKSQQDLVEKVIKEEESAFLRTLENGLKKMDQIKSDLQSKNIKIISGELAFELYDTYGFPLDLTALIAKENGLSVDEEGFQQAMKRQKDRSKSAAKMETGDWIVIREGKDVEFLGYDEAEAEASVLRYREVKLKKGSQIQLVLDRTPFYAESGGQIGDTGLLWFDQEKIKVIDTKKENDLIVHFIDKLPQNLKATVKAEINKERRRKIVYNHSATHLLHAALRQILGDHVQQKGSLVTDKLLRFDFSHFSKMTEEEIEEVESLVNQKIRENIAKQEDRNIPIAEAKEKGAMALFGEKYGDLVRVITFDPEYSVELCGGVHVQATGNIGQFKITSEASVASGVRRIEAITAEAAEELSRKQEREIAEIENLLKNPKDLRKAVEQLIADKNKIQKKLDEAVAKESQLIKKDLLSAMQRVGDSQIIVGKINLPNADALKKLAFELKNELSTIAAVLAADIAGKPQIAVVLSDDIIKQHDLNAGKMVRDLATYIKGGGGGQAFFATAGGKDITGLDQVVEEANSKLKEVLA